MRPSRGFAIGAYIFSFSVLFILSLAVSFWFSSDWYYGTNMHIVQTVYQWLAFGVLTLAYYQKRPFMQPCLRLNPIKPLTCILIVVAAMVGVFVLDWLSAYWLSFLSHMGIPLPLQSESLTNDAPHWLMLFISIALVPAVFEELLFRGLILPAFEQSSRRAAIFVSALLFSLLHNNIISFPVHTILGSVLASLVLYTGSLYASIVYHAVHNGTILIVNLISTQGVVQKEAADVSIASGAEMLSLLPTLLFFFILWRTLLRYTYVNGSFDDVSQLPPAVQSKSPILVKILLTLIFCFMFWLLLS